MFGNIKDTVLSLWENAIDPFITGFSVGWEKISMAGTLAMAVFDEFGILFDEIASLFGKNTDQMGANFAGLGSWIGEVAGVIVTIWLEFIRSKIESITDTIRVLKIAFKDLFGSGVKNIFSRIVKWLNDLLLKPIKIIA